MPEWSKGTVCKTVIRRFKSARLLHSIIFIALLTVGSSCKNNIVNKIGAINNDPSSGPLSPEQSAQGVSSCKSWGDAHLCLLTQGIGSGSTTTPTLTFKGLDKVRGRVQLYRNATCSNTVGFPATANGPEVNITAPKQNTFTAKYYAQYTHTDSTKSPCLGPVSWKVEESLSIALFSAIYSRVSFTVSELTLTSGRILLYKDSTCRTSASGSVSVNSHSHNIIANPLTSYGSFHFYVRHTDSENNHGNCIGPIKHDFVSGLQNNAPNFSLHPANKPRDTDSTPIFKLTNLDFESGQVQLFSSAGCHNPASNIVKYSYIPTGAAIIANPLSASGNYRYWAKITENIENQSRCVGPVSYEYIPLIQTESLTLSLSGSPLGSNPTPTLEVSGLIALNGTVQLFSESTCTTAASGTVNVTGATASITANALTAGTHQFYVQHTDSGGNLGDCSGPVSYSLETLSLALSSSNTPLDSDDTPHFGSVGTRCSQRDGSTF